MSGKGTFTDPKKEKLVSILSSEFDKYLMEHPEVSQKIPKNALLVFQLEGSNEFNEWSKKLSRKYQEKEQPLLFVYIKGLKPSLSRLIEPKLEKVV